MFLLLPSDFHCRMLRFVLLIICSIENRWFGTLWVQFWVFSSDPVFAFPGVEHFVWFCLCHIFCVGQPFCSTCYCSYFVCWLAVFLSLLVSSLGFRASPSVFDALSFTVSVVVVDGAIFNSSSGLRYFVAMVLLRLKFFASLICCKVLYFFYFNCAQSYAWASEVLFSTGFSSSNLHTHWQNFQASCCSLPWFVDSSICKIL